MVIAVDFDGTIVTHAYPQIGKPVPFAIDTLKKLQSQGHHQLILWSCREGQLLQDAIDYCQQRGLEFYAVNTNYPDEVPQQLGARKLAADIYIDDHNLGGLPDWGIIYQMIMSGNQFKPAPDSNMITENKPKKKQGLFLTLLKTIFA